MLRVRKNIDILIISVHPTLEFDEIMLFQEMGHRVCSLGFYFDSDYNELRPNPFLKVNKQWLDNVSMVFHRSGCKMSEGPDSWIISKEFCDLFDIIIVHHNFRFIESNWDVLRNKKVIWRTVGQELHWAENAMRKYREDGVYIVRWSNEEQDIPGYCGCDMVIHACKKETDFIDWIGDDESVITFNNNFVQRKKALNYDFYIKSLGDNIPRKLFGLNNLGVPGNLGVISYSEQLKVLGNGRVSFVTGTYPAPYTLGFVECWMSGIPVVHVGRSVFSLAGDVVTFEIDKLIINGVNGILVNTEKEAQKTLSLLLNDFDMAKELSVNGRKSAIKEFGVEQAKAKWEELFDIICIN